MEKFLSPRLRCSGQVQHPAHLNTFYLDHAVLGVPNTLYQYRLNQSDRLVCRSCVHVGGCPMFIIDIEASGLGDDGYPDRNRLVQCGWSGDLFGLDQP